MKKKGEFEEKRENKSGNKTDNKDENDWVSKSKAYEVAKSGMLIALAFIFSYIESLFPVSFGVPGIKLGLANLVILCALYDMLPLQVFAIMLGRIFLAGFLFGNMASIIYSLAGGILSFFVMLLVKKWDRFSMSGVSLLGGIFHNVGQLVVAMWVVSNTKLWVYLPVLILFGAICGFVIGISAQRCNSILKKHL